MRTITSRRNPVVAAFRAAERSRRASRRHLLLDGARLIDDAHRAGWPLQQAVFASEALRHADGQLARLARRLATAGVAVDAVSAPVLSAISPVRSPAGAVALARHRPQRAERAFARAGLVIAPVGVQDPGNVGAIIRAADAGAAAGVLVTDASADPFGWRALRGAMGSTFRVPVVDVGRAGTAIDAARAHGATVLAAVPRGGESVYDVDLTRPSLVLVGGEGGGLANGTAALADGCISVPMRRSVESLNAAVAAALIVYEARRQHGAQADPDSAEEES